MVNPIANEYNKLTYKEPRYNWVGNGDPLGIVQEIEI